ncbi:MAG: C40 family peptidase [Lentilactobacillus diolivorans]
MKFSKSLLALAFAGIIFGISTTSANADTYTSHNSAYSANYQTPETNQTNYSQETNSNQTNTNYAANSANTTAAQADTTSSKATAVINLAKQLAGQNIPYVWGGESLKGMDCSGLTDYVYQQAAGISLGHYTVTQESHVTKETVSNAQPGDLLFWGNQGASYHVAIYIGNNQYVAAPQPGQNVEIQTINSAFMPSFAGHVNG